MILPSSDSIAIFQISWQAVEKPSRVALRVGSSPLSYSNSDGPSVLLSKRRGKPSNRSYPSVVRTEPLALVKANYTDFGPTMVAEKGCGGNFGDGRAKRSCISYGSGSEHRTPDFGRTCPSGFKFALCESKHSDAMQELDGGSCDRRVSEALEPEHGTKAKLDGSVILFNEIIQIFRRSNSSPSTTSMPRERFARRTM